MAKKHIRGRKMMIIILGIVAIAAIILALTTGFERNRFQQVDQILYNPLMGFAPNADYAEAVGENTLVYVDVTWRELEPQKGEYDFAAIASDNQLDKWRSFGKNVVFRFVCDIPGSEEHRDIPDWLYDETGDGTTYDGSYGKGYSPNYENETFIEEHAKAIAALGKEYGDDSFFAYIELGSVGHWGEWHVKYDDGILRLPAMSVLERYITPYLEAFPKAEILMRRPFDAVTTMDLGVYNDMTGEPESTKEWLSWISDGGEYAQPAIPEKLTASPNIWERQPIGGEFTSSLTMEEMLVDKQSQTLTLLEQSHMTFIGPKCPIANEELVTYPEEVKKVLRDVGYRFGVSESWVIHSKITNCAIVRYKLHNYGVAPMYADWTVNLYTYDKSGQQLAVYPQQVSLKELCGKKSVWLTQKITDYKTESGVARIGIGIENPQTGEAAVLLDMDAPQTDKIYQINE